MKTKFLFTLMILFLSSKFFSQSTDLDRFYFTTKDVRLPQKYTEPEKRTYSVKVSDNMLKLEVLPESVILNSFKRDDANANFQFDIKLDLPIVYGDPEVRHRQEVDKDKEGRVTSTRNYYKVDQKMDAKATSLLNNQNYATLSHSEYFSTKEYSTSSEATENYKVQRTVWAENFKNQFQKEIVRQMNQYINKEYGQSLRDNTVKLWLLGSEKHPEYANQQKALGIIKDAFKKVEYSKIPENIITELAPAISVFENEISSFSEDNKKHRKVRYSAYYNLMKIYYHLDDMANAEKYANLLIKNEYDEKDGKNMLEDIQNRIKILETNKVKSTHIEVQNEKNYVVENKEF